MPVFSQRGARAVALVLAAFAAAALPAGCSGGGQHQVIGAGAACSSCHADEKAVFELAGVPDGVLESASQVIVETRSESVSVCVPLFLSEDGSRYVPEERERASAEDGRAELTLKDGLWALCVDEGASSRSVLVHVDSSRSDAATVEL
ncbi:hypothetical protein B5F40_03545 [Gordonibacter sp. An230]|uniref:hypothetical protein n=1 Tax=Gordonibacter sp. An230 TaxID=1965592 RepID=UPI000B56F269|nr:hypothetical protein [Gordonibacter sp. An230]OUO91570.1 hypothetical protein B5F40_03545 [Gordonibacter sp. An230]